MEGFIMWLVFSVLRLLNWPMPLDSTRSTRKNEVPMAERDYNKVVDGRVELTVHWNSELCTHCGNCLTGLPEVFDLNKRPWVNMDGADADRIAEQVGRCPSGALSLRQQ